MPRGFNVYLLYLDQAEYKGLVVVLLIDCLRSNTSAEGKGLRLRGLRLSVGAAVVHFHFSLLCFCIFISLGDRFWGFVYFCTILFIYSSI